MPARRRPASAGDKAAGNGNSAEAGKGVPKDRTEAVKWLRVSAQRGNKDAAAMLAKLERGSG